MQGKSLEDYNALMRLNVGEVSNSFQTTDLNGNQLSKIVKLVQIIPPHTASLTEDYIRIEEMALQNKQELVYNEWLKGKIAGMYIYIDPAYRSSDFEYDGWIK
jgi:peptidyl-prolyl cis-trans isomerase SurA